MNISFFLVMVMYNCTTAGGRNFLFSKGVPWGIIKLFKNFKKHVEFRNLIWRILRFCFLFFFCSFAHWFTKIVCIHVQRADHSQRATDTLLAFACILPRGFHSEMNCTPTRLRVSAEKLFFLIANIRSSFSLSP